MSYTQIDYRNLSTAIKKDLFKKKGISEERNKKYLQKSRAKNRVGKYFQSKLNAKPTPAESVFKKMLDENKIEYIQNMRFADAGRLYLVDFYILNSTNGCFGFEIDGGYHEKRKAYDYDRDRYLLRKHRVKIIRFKNERVLTDIAGVEKEVVELLYPNWNTARFL